jgi:NH3-dependent NAD+ synthetase
MESGNTTPHNQHSPSPDEHEHEQDEEDVLEPHEEMDSFDWQALETEYHDAMAQCKAKEDAHLQEFASLSQFFRVWAETISGHEQKRSHQRYVYLQPGNGSRLTLQLLA